MKRVRLGVLYGVLILLVGANVTAILHRQWIGDWLALRNYVPSAQISSLAAETTMTDAGRHLFYINHPSLEDRAGFNKHCANKTEHSVVLGCFHGDRLGIFVYDVQDERLEGVEQVTAAHEMLHQAYMRLGEKKRLEVDRMLQQFADAGELDKRIKDKIDLYKESEPDSLPNEMHSIFATEVRELPTELEVYYRQYFADRKRIVFFSEKYQGEFAARQAKVDSYDSQLEDLDTLIDHNKGELERRQRLLERQRTEVQGYLSRGDTAAYQAGANDYNKQVAAYNVLIDNTQQLIAQYNSIVAARNAISVEEQQLQKALDSRVEQPAAAN